MSLHIFSIPLGLGDLPFHAGWLFEEDSEHLVVNDSRGGIACFEPEVAVGTLLDHPLQE